MEFEWDEDKRHTNITKHGLDFHAAKEIWQGPVFVRQAEFRGESRFKAIGETKGIVIVVIYTWRRRRRRLISARQASRAEREAYYRALG